jgi:GNAT superfamily N-acetyltransferase
LNPGLGEIEMGAEIRTLVAADREQWERLARAYKAFYQTVLPDSAYEQTWQRLLQQDGIHGFCAQVDGRLVGMTHYLFHTGIWTPKVCYLEDLFVEPATRGQGIARALIDAVAHFSRTAGATRLYWLTHETNATARALYDKVAKYSGFLEYEYPL